MSFLFGLGVTECVCGSSRKKIYVYKVLNHGKQVQGHCCHGTLGRFPPMSKGFAAFFYNNGLFCIYLFIPVILYSNSHVCLPSMLWEMYTSGMLVRPRRLMQVVAVGLKDFLFSLLRERSRILKFRSKKSFDDGRDERRNTRLRGCLRDLLLPCAYVRRASLCRPESSPAFGTRFSPA